MPAPTFPSSLSGVSAFRLSTSTNVYADEQEGAPRDHNLLSVEPGAVVASVWRFLEDDYQTFREFWTSTLLNGHRWFEMGVPSAAGLVTHIMRFDGPYVTRILGHRAFEVTVNIEVRERRMSL